MRNKTVSLCLLIGFHLAMALGAESVNVTRDEIFDRIRGGWTGMLIGGIEGLAHEFKYIQQPRQELPDFTFLPQGARTDDDNDFEWTHLFFMEKEGALKVPYPRLVEIWKANMNTGIWCANEQARKLMDKGVIPPGTADPSVNRFAPFNLAGQFCVESYGMIAPGMPQSAAELGLHYARVSVSGEPLQAAQYWTTLISLAGVSSEPLEELLKKSLAAVDPASAQAEAVREGINAFHQHPTDWKAARQYFHEKWYFPKEKPWNAQARPPKWNDNSTPLNGAMVVLALLYGRGDFYRTGQHAMALGYDADCNAATACAVIGTRIGFTAIEKLPRYRMPDRYINLTRPDLPRESKVSEQAALMLRLSEKLILANGGQAITIDGKLGYRIQLQPPRLLASSGGSQAKTQTITKGSLEKHSWVLAYFRQRYEGRVEIDAQGRARQVPLPNPMKEEQLHLALSTDGRHWEPLNGNRPVWDQWLRDPFLGRGPDGLWHLLTTGGGRRVRTGETNLGPACLYATSRDLLKWENVRSLRLMQSVRDETGRLAQNIWAPEWFLDRATDEIVLLWSSSFEDAGWKRSRLWFSRTRDWQTFTPAKVLFAPPYSVIDGTLFEHGGAYYLFHKEEEFSPSTGERRAIRLATADRLEGPYHIHQGPLNQGQIAPVITEGPAVMPDPRKPGWLLLYDYCMSNSYGISSSPDLIRWSIEESVSLPPDARHGSVARLSAAEAAVLRSSFPDKNGSAKRN